MLHPIFLGCLLCCGLGALTAAVPALPASSKLAEASDEPDLLHMLDYFKGRSDITMLTTFLKQADILKTALKGIFDICTLCQQVFEDAGKTSVGFRILDKVMEGHAPDIRDMYDLATKGIGNMTASFNEARKKNKKLNNSVKILLFEPSSVLFSSPTEIHNVLLTFTGKNFIISSQLLEDVRSGNVKFDVNNVHQANLLEMILYWSKNQNVWKSFMAAVFTPPVNLHSLTSTLNALDTTNLAMIKSIKGGMNNDKYTVAGAGQTIVTDPTAERLIVDFEKLSEIQKGKSADDHSAESMMLTMIVDFMKLSTQVLKAAEVNRKVANHQM